MFTVDPTLPYTVKIILASFGTYVILFFVDSISTSYFQTFDQYTLNILIAVIG